MSLGPSGLVSPLVTQGYGPGSTPGDIIRQGYTPAFVTVVTDLLKKGGSKAKKKIREVLDTLKIEAALVAVNGKDHDRIGAASVSRVIAESTVAVGKIVASQITKRVIKPDYKIIITEVKVDKDV